MAAAHTAGVYEIANTRNGRAYIGSSAHISRRLSQHKHALAKGTHHSPALQSAWSKYGPEAFTFKAIIYCEPAHCMLYEQRAIDILGTHPNGYNARKDATTNLGVKRSPEYVSAMRARKVSDATRQRMSEAAKRRVRSPEEKARLRGQIVAAARDPVNIAKRLARVTGVPRSEETVKKMSAAHKGKRPSQKCLDALAAYHASRRKPCG